MNALNTFRYTAVDATGRVVEGVIQAASPEQAATQLEQDGLQATSIVPDPTAAAVESGTETRPAVDDAAPNEAQDPAVLKPKEWVQLGQDVAQLGAAGLPLVGGLEALAAELPQGRYRLGLEQINRRLRAGESLDAALDHQGSDADLVAILRAGRQADNTLDLIEMYVAQMGIRSRIRSRAILGMVYPVTMMLIVAAVVLALLVFVVPDFEEIYLDFGVELPLLTKFVLAVSQLVINYWKLGLAILAMAVFLLVWLEYLSRTSYRLRMLVWKIPWMGSLVRWSALSRFSRLLAIFVKRSIPLPSALRFAGDATNDVCLVRDAGRLAERVKQGQGFTDGVAGLREFPASFVELLNHAGDEVTFSESLESIADIFEARVYSLATLSSQILEPALYVMLGGLVGLITISLFAPLFRLLDALS